MILSEKDRRSVIKTVGEFFDSCERKTLIDGSARVDPLPEGAFVLSYKGIPVAIDTGGAVVPADDSANGELFAEAAGILKENFGCMPPWYVKRVGSFPYDMIDESALYRTKAEAIAKAEQEMAQIIGIDDPNDYVRDGIHENGYGSLCDNIGEKYYSWKIRKKKEISPIEAALLYLDDAEDGLSQYSYELIDSGCCSGYIQQAEDILQGMLDSVNGTEFEGPVTADEVTGCIGNMLGRDTSDLPAGAVRAMQQAYDICCEKA